MDIDRKQIDALGHRHVAKSANINPDNVT
jgi:hypothetical protein